MDKLKTYKNFENLKTGVDENVEEEIDKILALLIKQKLLVSMLGDTITHVCQMIENVFPQPLDEFTAALEHYDEEIYKAVDDIRENMIEGCPNIKDMVEDVENDFKEIEKHLTLKGLLNDIKKL